uniref:Uncharacterized protein n=1 Tax=Romanomermis culicivorax TaxID=13658 RepID=A0A915KII0_ROMCU
MSSPIIRDTVFRGRAL